MITIVEYADIMFVGETRKAVDCPSCRKPLVFYNMSPDMCMHCGGRIISATCLLTNNTYKINYHNGLVSDNGFLKMMAG